MQLFATLPEGERIVSMIEFQGRLLVATSERVFAVVDDKLYPLTFVNEGGESEEVSAQ